MNGIQSTDEDKEEDYDQFSNEDDDDDNDGEEREDDEDEGEEDNNALRSKYYHAHSTNSTSSRYPEDVSCSIDDTIDSYSDNYIQEGEYVNEFLNSVASGWHNIRLHSFINIR